MPLNILMGLCPVHRFKISKIENTCSAPNLLSIIGEQHRTLQRVSHSPLVTVWVIEQGTATAQQHQRGSDCTSAWDKIKLKIPSLLSIECVLFLHLY